MDEPDPEGFKGGPSERRAVGMAVGRRVFRLVPVLVKVGVRVHHVAVAMRVSVQITPLPADEQTHGESDDEEADGHFRRRVDGLREEAAEENHGHPQGEYSHRVPEAPPETQGTGICLPAFIPGEHEGGNGGYVIGIGGVAETEQESREQGHGGAPAAELRDPLVQGGDHRRASGEASITFREFPLVEMPSGTLSVPPDPLSSPSAIRSRRRQIARGPGGKGLEGAHQHIIQECMPKHRHQEFLRFMNTVARTTAKDLDIHVIFDNYAMHKHPNVKQWLHRFRNENPPPFTLTATVR